MYGCYFSTMVISSHNIHCLGPASYRNYITDIWNTIKKLDNTPWFKGRVCSWGKRMPFAKQLWCWFPISWMIVSLAIGNWPLATEISLGNMKIYLHFLSFFLVMLYMVGYSSSTMNSQYIAVIYNTMIHTEQQLQLYINNFSQSLISWMTPHISPSWVSYGVSFLRSSKKYDHDIPRASCSRISIRDSWWPGSARHLAICSHIAALLGVSINLTYIICICCLVGININ